MAEEQILLSLVVDEGGQLVLQLCPDDDEAHPQDMYLTEEFKNAVISQLKGDDVVAGEYAYSKEIDGLIDTIEKEWIETKELNEHDFDADEAQAQSVKDKLDDIRRNSEKS